MKKAIAPRQLNLAEYAAKHRPRHRGEKKSHNEKAERACKLWNITRRGLDKITYISRRDPGRVLRNQIWEGTLSSSEAYRLVKRREKRVQWGLISANGAYHPPAVLAILQTDLMDPWRPWWKGAKTFGGHRGGIA